jgi:hypothetical protein
MRARLFKCDVEITVKHLAKRDPRCARLWLLHFREGKAWRPCCEEMKIDRGTFYHLVYDTEQLLGEMFIERGIAPPSKYYDWGHEPILAKSVEKTSSVEQGSQLVPWECMSWRNGLFLRRTSRLADSLKGS